MEQLTHCCLNCKHYFKHYIIRGTHFRYTSHGHCNHDKLYARRTQLKYELYDKCDRWESNEEKLQEREQSIKSVLKDMRKHLSEISQILTEDK